MGGGTPRASTSVCVAATPLTVIPAPLTVIPAQAGTPTPRYTPPTMATATKPQTITPPAAKDPVLIITLPPTWPITDESFCELLSLNDHLQMEIDEQGRLLIMGSGGFLSSARAAAIITQIGNWIAAAGSGFVTGEAGFFRTAAAGRRAPDVAWTSPERAAAAIAGDEGVGPLCPDFLVEILSPTDRLPTLQEKLEMWLEQGVRLAWLLDPHDNIAWIYRPGQEPERHDRPQTLSGENILPGLTVDLAQIWTAPVD